jgi:hypothetical protein
MLDPESPIAQLLIRYGKNSSTNHLMVKAEIQTPDSNKRHEVLIYRLPVYVSSFKKYYIYYIIGDANLCYELATNDLYNLKVDEIQKLRKTYKDVYAGEVDKIYVDYFVIQNKEFPELFIQPIAKKVTKIEVTSYIYNTVLNGPNITEDEHKLFLNKIEKLNENTKDTRVIKNEEINYRIHHRLSTYFFMYNLDTSLSIWTRIKCNNNDKDVPLMLCRIPVYVENNRYPLYYIYYSVSTERVILNNPKEREKILYNLCDMECIKLERSFQKMYNTDKQIYIDYFTTQDYNFTTIFINTAEHLISTIVFDGTSSSHIIDPVTIDINKHKRFLDDNCKTLYTEENIKNTDKVNHTTRKEFTRSFANETSKITLPNLSPLLINSNL